MIIGEKEIKTKKEKDFLFKKLHDAGFRWASGDSLLRNALSNNWAYPIYIHIHDTNKITYSDGTIPESSWGEEYP